MIARSLAGRSVATHLRILRWCGFCRLQHGGGSSRGSELHRVYCIFSLSVTSLYLMQECVYAYRKHTDMEKLARVMFLLLCHVTSIVKQLVFFVDADRIDAMVAAFDDPVFGGCEERHAALLRAARRGAARFVRAYSSCAVLTCTLWLVFPIVDRARGLPVEFPFWVPFERYTSNKFVAVLVYSYYVTTLVGVANTTMDAFVATVLLQCKTQLAILRMKFETLTERARVFAAETPGCSFEDAWRHLFVDCCTHYKMISNTTKTLQDIFGTAILVQFGIGGWILCMAAYKIVNLSVLSIEFASMTLFICCILTELFLYCYYGNEVTVESGGVAGAAYGGAWAALGAAPRRCLLLAMLRAARPLRPAAGLVMPLSLDTFIKILKSSYTFYAVLRQTK